MRYYNWERLDYVSDQYNLGPFQQGFADWFDNGGFTTGANFDLTHSFSDKLTVTLQGQYNVLHPIWDDYLNLYTPFSALYGDFLTPGAPCAGIAAGSGYVSCAYGTGTVLAPAFGINENGSFFQNYGFGLALPVQPDQ